MNFKIRLFFGRSTSKQSSTTTWYFLFVHAIRFCGSSVNLQTQRSHLFPCWLLHCLLGLGEDSSNRKDTCPGVFERVSYDTQAIHCRDFFLDSAVELDTSPTCSQYRTDPNRDGQDETCECINVLLWTRESFDIDVCPLLQRTEFLVSKVSVDTLIIDLVDLDKQSSQW